ncbi:MULTISPECIES: hypothetical protein [Paenibacillus]|jgi:hypothetical protein|uniref:DUF3951 domain-containing protein n=1 Tax=Paenibacillus baimaensis TaxID=2982185 RepID=A0ABT2U927_9BACL|nr:MULTISPECIES: hypothetical protein [unclassified Paenibacillus]MCU6791145.1 hypothetical protein [Paenibacillus sp. WQ 127069]OMF19098.1 hypothetical protein BK127_08110 [Paenibacillus sp. FSL H7-0331]
MIQEMTVYAIVFFVTIGIMLILCIDVISRSRPVKLSTKKEMEIQMDGAQTSTDHYEKNLAFPFYVDCTQSSDQERIEH